MFTRQNKRVRLEDDGLGYEIFWTSANVDHMVRKLGTAEHLPSLVDIERFAERAFFIAKGLRNEPHQYQKVFGLARHLNNFYQIVGYFTDKPTRRCIVETCSLVNDNKIRLFCQRNPHLIA